ncbi:putative methyltransferase-domain-containing protein [Nemania sp. FL0916]|nr:putative methyltransferase-domain-containing protein [Nemania sp. FL0916]
MHYIRLLRPAKLQSSSEALFVSLLFTITTDLGDSFLCPEDGSMDLAIIAEHGTADPADPAAAEVAIAQRGRLTCRCKWKTGMRVLDAKVKLWPGSRPEAVNCRVVIQPAQQEESRGNTVSTASVGVLRVGDLLPWIDGEDKELHVGVVMPTAFDFVNGVCAPVSVRTLGLGAGFFNRGNESGSGSGSGSSSSNSDHLNLYFEEDIGESIARHIWDAGVVTSAYLADESHTISDIFPVDHENFSVLELGTGVGILGITIASILPRVAAAQKRVLGNARVLLTDLEEAEERARSNIAKAKAALALNPINGTRVTIEYENLDWDEGREGRFGPLAAAVPWDFVTLSDCTYNVDSLPALVGTLTALHRAKECHQDPGKGSLTKSSVLLATKPRHSSEEALFGLLKDQGWTYWRAEEIPLPKIGEKREVVQIYVLQKSSSFS